MQEFSAEIFDDTRAALRLMLIVDETALSCTVRLHDKHATFLNLTKSGTRLRGEIETIVQNFSLSVSI